MLRFWNSDVVENMAGVLEKIARIANEARKRQANAGARWSTDT